jgi:hypothetical protein
VQRVMEGCIEGVEVISYVSRSCAAVEVGGGGVLRRCIGVVVLEGEGSITVCNVGAVVVNVKGCWMLFIVMWKGIMGP